MSFGVCYYPEHWPPARWTVDAQMMRAAGLTLVRIGEFAWANMEPAEGQYAWDWLDRAIETLAGAGLQLILGTPTATPPAWLTRAYPDILRVDASGRPRDHGTRRHYCPNSPTYQAYSAGIVTAMLGRYGAHPAVVGWQIDNEFGGGQTARCYCDWCAAAFRRWLQARYGSLAALNEAWGNVFWSQTYSDWAQIALPGARVDKRSPSHELDYFRFSSDAWVAYQQLQIDLVRRYAPGRVVTTNFMGLFPDLDQYDLAAPLDLVSWDNYPTGNPERWRPRLYAPGRDNRRNDPTYAYDVGEPIITSLAHALTRSLKQRPFWVMEQQCGQINWGDVNPGVRPGSSRLWAWHAVAEGAAAVLYFRWRATRFAHEQYHSGLLHHDGSPDVGYGDHLRLEAERALLDEVMAAPCPPAGVGLLFDFADLWALQLQPHRADFGYLRHLFVYYEALQRLGIPVDLVSPAGDLSPYRLLIAPTAHLAGEALAGRLADYVAGGGTLLLGVRSGFKTPSNLVTADPLPGELQHLVGATVTDWQSLPPEVGWPLVAETPALAALGEDPAGFWVERLRPGKAQVLVRYAGGGAALTMNERGPGRVYYLGWYPPAGQARTLLAYLASQTGLQPIASDLPPGLLALRRAQFIFLLNFTDRPLTATPAGYTITVAPRDVWVGIAEQPDR